MSDVRPENFIRGQERLQGSQNRLGAYAVVREAIEELEAEFPTGAGQDPRGAGTPREEQREDRVGHQDQDGKEVQRGATSCVDDTDIAADYHVDSGRCSA